MVSRNVAVNKKTLFEVSDLAQGKVRGIVVKGVKLTLAITKEN